MKPFISVMNIMLTACIIFFATGCSQSSEENNLIQNEIDSISSRFIPDQRMGIAHITSNHSKSGTLILKGETTDPDLKTTLITTLGKKHNALIDSIIILPDTLKNKKYTGLVTLSVINIRRQPDHKAELVSQALLGTPVRILDNKGYWLLIQTPDNYIGWTESSSVESMTTDEMVSWKSSGRVITLVNSGWIFTSPGETETIGDFTAGCIFEKEGENNAHTKVRLPDGREGYINSRVLTDFKAWRENVRCTEESIVRSASTFIGLPYLWGGSSSKGVDCSGFSQSVYYLNGIILSRDASLQALHGLNVDISSGYGQLRPGDLLFFGTKENTKLHVTHVGVYKGDSEYFNSSGRVMVNSLDSTRSNYNGYRENSLLAAKRIIGVNDDPGIVSIRSHPWY
jgi:gamma-D-glutamyl-L-lysine dipeptidyl-peptidase